MPAIAETMPYAPSGWHDADYSVTTLAIRPLVEAPRANGPTWIEARQRLGQIAGLRPGWNGQSGAAPDPHTLAFAAKELVTLQKQGLPAPVVNPSPDGSIYAEWHAGEIDIELVFEGPYDVILLAHDERGEMPDFEDSDPDLSMTTAFLHKLRIR